MKKLAFIFFAIFISAALFAAGGQSGTQAARTAPGAIPSYINLDGHLPVVKPGNNISMTLSWQPNETYANTSDPADIWWFRFVREAMNIDLRVSARGPGAEVKNLMFASGDLPDIWLYGLTTDDIVQYGVAEKMLLPISDYLTPELMPNLYKAYQDAPELASPSTASDGKIYGFPNFRGKDWLHGPITGGLARVYFQKQWLDQLNMKVPETLDEYLNVLRGYKSIGSDVLPDAGIFNSNNNFVLLFSALGFHWTTNYNGIITVGTRNNKVTFVYGDRDIYPKFLETYKTMYDEGLITRDFFTMDNNARVALTMSGKGGCIPFNLVTMTGQTHCFNYVSAKPLTSEFNREMLWGAPSNYVVINLAAITSKNRYPEAACRMFDFGFTPENGVLVYYGYPDTQVDKMYGMSNGWTIFNNRIDILRNNNNPPIYENDGYFGNNRIRPMNDMVGFAYNFDTVAMRMYGMNPPPEAFNPTNPDSYARGSTYQNLSPHVKTDFPFVIYWDEARARRISDLSSVLNDFANIQFAQFVTGARPLSDLNNYFAELDRMGYQEYLRYFTEYYAGYKSGK